MTALHDLRQDRGGSDDRSVVERLYRENDHEGSARPPMTVARNVVAAFVIAASSIQVVLWAVISLGTGSLMSPWWVWTLLGGGIVVGALSIAAARPAAQRTRPRRAAKPVSAGSGQRSWLTWQNASRVAIWLFVLATAAQIVVWFVQGVVNGFDAPWWAWSALPQAGLTAVVMVLAKHERGQDEDGATDV